MIYGGVGRRERNERSTGPGHAKVGLNLRSLVDLPSHTTLQDVLKLRHRTVPDHTARPNRTGPTEAMMNKRTRAGYCALAGYRNALDAIPQRLRHLGHSNLFELGEVSDRSRDTQYSVIPPR